MWDADSSLRALHRPAKRFLQLRRFPDNASSIDRGNRPLPKNSNLPCSGSARTRTSGKLGNLIGMKQEGQEVPGWLARSFDVAVDWAEAVFGSCSGWNAPDLGTHFWQQPPVVPGTGSWWEGESFVLASEAKVGPMDFAFGPVMKRPSWRRCRPGRKRLGLFFAADSCRGRPESRSQS